MSRFEQILGGPALETPAAVLRVTVPTRNKVESITLNKETQDQYWKSVLTNAYFLRYPAGDGRFIPMRSLYEVLERLQQGGAGLARVEEQPRPGKPGLRQPGKISRLKLEQGRVPQAEWDRVRAEELPKYKDQLRWLFTLSVMGAAAEYVDLGVELPAEWVDDTLKKYGQRIQELREAVIAVMIDKNKNLYFEIEGGGKTYCLAPGKTGRRRPGGRPIVELTPEEAVLVAEAQEAGLLEPGPEGALSALKWAG